MSTTRTSSNSLPPEYIFFVFTPLPLEYEQFKHTKLAAVWVWSENGQENGVAHQHAWEQPELPAGLHEPGRTLDEARRLRLQQPLLWEWR